MTGLWQVNGRARIGFDDMVRMDLQYIETYSLPLGADGQPRPELFVADKLHLNAAGYKLLAERVRPYLPH